MAHSREKKLAKIGPISFFIAFIFANHGPHVALILVLLFPYTMREIKQKGGQYEKYNNF